MSEIFDTLGDPTRLRQVLYNLCNNAVKFTDRGRVDIEVRVESTVRRETWLRFSVADTGIGISPSTPSPAGASVAASTGASARSPPYLKAWMSASTGKA